MGQNMHEPETVSRRRGMRGTRSKEPSPVKPVILIGLMGVTGSGKSNFAKLASNDQKIIVGGRLSSCTKTVLPSDVFEVEGHMVQLVDTPGFNDDELSDAQVLELIADWMKKSFNEKQKLHGIMYLQRITDTRLDGGAVRSLQLFGDICGPDFLKNTVLLTTMWDKGQSPNLVEEYEDTEQELKGDYWKELIQSGAMYMRSYNKKDACNEILNQIVQKLPEIPKLQQEVAINGLDVGDTGAGANLMKVLTAEMERITKVFQDRVRKLEESHAKLVEERNLESKAVAKERELWAAKLEKFERDQLLLTPRERSRRFKSQESIDKSNSRKKWSVGMGERIMSGLGFNKS